MDRLYEAKAELQRRETILNNLPSNCSQDLVEAALLDITAQERRVNAIIQNIKEGKEDVNKEGESNSCTGCTGRLMWKRKIHRIFGM